MSALFNAANTNDTLTENGAIAHSSTLNANLDLFSQIGASRGRLDFIKPLFLKALGEDPKTAIQILFWVRDIRGGQGERDLFRSLIHYVSNSENIDRLLDMILEVGRADDLFVFENTEYERNLLRKLCAEIRAENALVAKWMPRKKGLFEKLRRYMRLTPKELRTTLANLSKVVEQQMSSGNWGDIKYQSVPSRASLIYKKAFINHDPYGYESFLEKVNSGDVTINAKALYPYDVTNKVRVHENKYLEDPTYQALWDALPNYLEGNDANILPVIDVSHSMKAKIPNTKMTCMDMAVSLGLYVSERNNTAFKDEFITFHQVPSMVKVKGSLAKRLETIYKSPWGGSTNIQKTFMLILDAAIRSKLKQEDLPSHLLIFSDMQFNRIQGYNSENKSAFDWAKNVFEEHGYKLPNVIFWNLRSTSNYPVQEETTGTALVSGYSPSLLKTILSGEVVEEPTPIEVMLETIDKERYTI